MRGLLARLITSMLLIGVTLASPINTDGSKSIRFTVDEIFSRIAEANYHRDQLLRTYTDQRTYTILHGASVFGQTTATVRYLNGRKTFTVDRIEGKHGETAFRRVFKPMLEAEIESAHDPVKAQSSLSPRNYELSQLGEEDCGNGRVCLKLRANPIGKKKDLLFAGIIWLDALDFAVVRAEGNPAKIPLGVSEAPFQRTYSQVNGIYFPKRVESQIKLYKVAGLFTSRDFRLVISYGNYQLNQ